MDQKFEVVKKTNKQKHLYEAAFFMLEALIYVCVTLTIGRGEMLNFVDIMLLWNAWKRHFSQKDMAVTAHGR